MILLVLASLIQIVPVHAEIKWVPIAVDCNRAETKVPPPPLAQGEKHFSTIEDAMKYADQSYHRDLSILSEKYCDLLKTIQGKKSQAECKVLHMGSYGVDDQDHTLAQYKILELTCEMMIPCEIDSDILSGRGNTTIINAIKKKCREEFNFY